MKFSEHQILWFPGSGPIEATPELMELMLKINPLLEELKWIEVDHNEVQ